MSSRAAPWWLFVLAASYLAYFGLLIYCDVRRPEPLADVVLRPAGMLLREVPPGSAAARAGLRPGDRIVEAAGRVLRSRGDWAAVEANLRLDEPLSLVVERQGERLVRPADLRLDSSGYWRTWAGIVLLTSRLTQFATLCIALLVAFKKPHDRVARLGAWLLATCGVTCISFPNRWAAVWRDLPDSVGALLWAPFASSLATGAILFTFFAAFPRPLVRKPWIWAVCWAPMVLVVASYLPEYASLVYRPQTPAAAPGTDLIMMMAASYSAAGLIALAVNYRRLEDVNDRRRVRVLIPGSVIGVVSFLVLTISYWVQAPESVTAPLYGSPTMVVGGLVLLALPLSFAYAILRRRMFDLSTLVRQGIRYALARRVVLSAVPLLIAVLGLDLALQHDRSLGETLAARLSAYAVLIALAIYASWRRERWLAALDRRFFRERCDGQRLLREVVEQIRKAASIEQVAPFVVSRIEAALHLSSAALLVRSPREAAYRVLASVPGDGTALSLPGDSRLVALVRLLGKPLDTALTDSGWLKDQLPHGETEFLRQTRIGLLVPIATAAGRQEALLALGVKRSEEPYSSEDQELLAAVAASLGLLIERPATVSATDQFEECPRCGVCYDTGTVSCSLEGSALAAIRLPRTLGERYRLERRLGCGGMGTVYEASDTSLERRIAVKVIREELVGSAETAERFRREARAAASFSHPNVVTVHDFGVVAGTRAYLVMELLRGATLRTTLRAEGRLAPERVMVILRDVCAAMHAAHEQQLVHRDLKPENVFLTKDVTGERAKVLDFGIAKFLAGDILTTPGAGPGQVIGTLPYMAPEQLRNEAPRPAWDIWALGVLSYELLTGSLPFATAGAGASTGSSAVWPEPFDARLAGSLLPFRRLFARALAVDPRERPATAHELFTAFEDAFRASEGLALAPP